MIISVTEPAYAKINLYLEVFEKKNDGYHNIDSIMQTVSLCDIVSIQYGEEISGINLTCNMPDIPCDMTNIASRCAKAYLDYCKLSGGVNIHIEKNIPQSAGLGGGSADGGAVLRGLNKINNNSLTIQELCSLGSQIGADIPFCTVGGAIRCRGKGDVFSPSAGLGDHLYIVIGKGKQGSNTAQAYQSLDKIVNRTTKQLPSTLEDGLKTGNLDRICSELFNAFECVVLPQNKECSAIKRALSIFGAKASLMSGSGSAVFGIFDNSKKANEAAVYLNSKGYFSGCYSPINATIE